ncbi:hypothetical protein Ahia01_000400600 [Argonauta hians]
MEGQFDDALDDTSEPLPPEAIPKKVYSSSSTEEENEDSSDYDDDDLSICDGQEYPPLNWPFSSREGDAVINRKCVLARNSRDHRSKKEILSFLPDS